MNVFSRSSSGSFPRTTIRPKNVFFIFLTAVLTLQLLACGKTSFVGSSHSKTPNEPTPQVPQDCHDAAKTRSLNIAFVIDNSSSNVATDCPNPKMIDNKSGMPQFRCEDATQRELTILSTVDALKKSENQSHFVSVISFPKTIYEGYILQSPWISVETAKSRELLEISLAFTRLPFGQTPYGSALLGVKEVFEKTNLSSESKSHNIAILITDGEPTDQNGIVVTQLSESLKAQSIELFSIFVTQGIKKEARMKNHLEALKQFDKNSAPKRYFDTKAYADFDAYADHILGRNGRKSLLEDISNIIFPIEQVGELNATIEKIIALKKECVAP